MKEILYGPGEVIFTAGDVDEKMFFVFKGEIELFIGGGEGEEKDINYDKKKVMNNLTCLLRERGGLNF